MKANLMARGGTMADGLRLLADDVWGYDFILAGTRHSGSTGIVKNKTLARAYIEDLKAKLRKELADAKLGIKADPIFSVGTLWKAWLENHTGAHAERVERDWNLHILPTLKDVEVMKVTTAMVEGIRTAYMSGPSLRNAHYAEKIKAKAEARKKKNPKEAKEVPQAKPRTGQGGNKLMTHLCGVFGWAVKTERIPRMPFKQLDELIEQEPVRTFLRKEQVKPFLARVDSKGNLHQMVAIRAMLYLGLREDEALHMKWTGFDGDRKVFTAVDTKTGKNIPLPVPEDLRVLLKRLRERVPEDCEWCLPAFGAPYEPHTAQFTTKPIKAAGKAMGITGLHPHRMRGSMATLMARAGASAFVIKKMGRWKRSETAEKYVQVVEEDLEVAQNNAFDFS
jgi:integrase